jgi:hypothetical protein
MPNKDAVTILVFLVQQIGLLLITSGVLAQVKFGSIAFEFSIKDGHVTHSKPRLELDIRAEGK